MFKVQIVSARSATEARKYLLHSVEHATGPVHCKDLGPDLPVFAPYHRYRFDWSAPNHCNCPPDDDWAGKETSCSSR